MQEINGDVSNINKKVEVVNVVESKYNDDKMNEDEDINIDNFKQQVSYYENIDKQIKQFEDLNANDIQTYLEINQKYNKNGVYE